ncbi:hypothetical protein DFH94DRAFT_689197 [Russula ochroleuca]|uniref:Uncharacterized protein n=1 Tax=Russula ochroleuca TaxID=152965 RepID=A0A9P5TCU5_9AGAM|nr:hypothetical protein DFH94DRAFT_689197 [Russula ochroleuca]
MRSDKQATPFLFASPDRRAAAPSSSSARRVHLRRLCDILHLSIQRGDLPLARNAFGLLARCEDVEWPDIWKFGLVLLATADGDAPPSGDADADVVVGTPKHIEFLQVMMLRYPEQRETLVRELVLSLAMAGRERDALDELELYLPSPPYQDNSVLHTYAGLLCLRLAQSTTDANASRKGGDASEQTLLREAQQHLERARALDPEGVVAPAFIRRLATLTPEYNTASNESDDDMIEVDSKGLGRKRIRI